MDYTLGTILLDPEGRKVKPGRIKNSRKGETANGSYKEDLISVKKTWEFRYSELPAEKFDPIEEAYTSSVPLPFSFSDYKGQKKEYLVAITDLANGDLDISGEWIYMDVTFSLREA